MSGLATLERPVVAADEDSAKRRQIVEGARAIFLSQGFDAASMNDIARAAGVSKGTLYVYFKHKEQLFEAIIEQECELQAEGIFDLDPNDHDVEAVLTRLGFRVYRFSLPSGKSLRHSHRHRHCRAHAGAWAEILRERTGQRHQPSLRHISRRRSMPACSTSRIAKSPPRS